MIKAMEKYVYQMFILGLDNVNEALHKGLGGVIFFSKDIKSEQSLKSKISEIKSKSLIPPFISIDQEGGRVERTENIRPKRLSAREAFLQNKVYKQAEEISKELAMWGFNLNFAPCADVNTNPQNPIIGERAFSDNPDDVIKGVADFMQASEKYGVIPCVKHYPGHGDANKDSHLTLPEIDLSMDEMVNIHIKPFKAAIDNGVKMIMAAHLYCKCFDREVIPASLSKNAIGYLRNNLKYNGVVISDDMVMKGVRAYGSLEACLMGIDAGIDMFIFRNSDGETLNMIDNLVKLAEKDTILQEKIIKSNERIMKLKQSLK